MAPFVLPEMEQIRDRRSGDGRYAKEPAQVILRQQHQAVARIVRTLVFPANAELYRQIAADLPGVLTVEGQVLLTRRVIFRNTGHVAGSRRGVIVALLDGPPPSP